MRFHQGGAKRVRDVPRRQRL